MLYFTWAKSYANEGKQRIFLICFLIGLCELIQSYVETNVMVLAYW